MREGRPRVGKPTGAFPLGYRCQQLTYFLGKPAGRFSLSRQPLCFQAFPIFVKRLLRFFVIAHSLFCLDRSKRLVRFALGGRRFSSFNGVIFPHFYPRYALHKLTRGLGF